MSITDSVLLARKWYEKDYPLYKEVEVIIENSRKTRHKMFRKSLGDCTALPDTIIDRVVLPYLASWVHQTELDGMEVDRTVLWKRSLSSLCYSCNVHTSEHKLEPAYLKKQNDLFMCQQGHIEFCMGTCTVESTVLGICIPASCMDGDECVVLILNYDRRLVIEIPIGEYTSIVCVPPWEYNQEVWNKTGDIQLIERMKRDEICKSVKHLLQTRQLSLPMDENG